MNFRRLTSFILSAALLTAALPLNMSASASLSAPELSFSEKEVSLSEIEITPDTVQASSLQEAGSQMRSYMTERKTSFTISIPRNSVSDLNDAPGNVLAEAMKETSKGNEGDYLRYGLKKYSCNFSGSSSVITMNFTMEYYTSAQDEQKVAAECSSLLASLDLGGMSDYDRIKTIYRHIASHTSYASNTNDKHVFTAYGALIDHVAVCQGYSQLFYRLMKESGIDCRIISGTSDNENHAWNIVKLDDKYYLMDVTWDSSLGGNSMIYFLRGSKDFDVILPDYTHIPVYQNNIIFEDFNSAQFKAAYPISDYKYDPSAAMLLGDVSGNRIIDAVDSSAILKYYAETSAGHSGNFTANQKTAADVNKNGTIDAVDASFVLAYYAASSVRNVGSLSDFIRNMK